MFPAAGCTTARAKPVADRGIHGIAALAHNLDACVSRQVMNADDHRVLRPDGLLFEVIGRRSFGRGAKGGKRHR